MNHLLVIIPELLVRDVDHHHLVTLPLSHFATMIVMGEMSHQHRVQGHGRTVIKKMHGGTTNHGGGTLRMHHCVEVVRDLDQIDDVRGRWAMVDREDTRLCAGVPDRFGGREGE